MQYNIYLVYCSTFLFFKNIHNNNIQRVTCDNVFTADTLRHAVALMSDPLIFNLCSVSDTTY